MGIGFPTKANWSAGDLLTAAQIDDLAGTLNLLQNSAFPIMAGKNAIINGGMDIWQRGTSIALAASTAYTSGFTADRWQTATGANQACTISRQATGDTTNLPNVQYVARYQRNSGQTGTAQLSFAQTFETINSIPFAGKQITLSFYARAGANYSAAANALGVVLAYGTGTDQNIFTGFTGQVSLISSSATLTTTIQRFTFTATLPSTATQLAVVTNFVPTGTAGANDYFEITGVQLELGSTATTFSRAGGSIGGELALCQRYYQRVAATTSLYSGTGFAYATTAAFITVPTKQTMRTSPATLDYTTPSLSDGVTSTTGTTVTINAGSTPDLVVLSVTVAAGLTQFRPYILASTNASGYVGFSAEL